jgi:tyrosyl-tRNA synthetase
LPSYEVENSRLATGISVATLAHLAGLVRSSSDARRAIQNGGIRVNDIPVTDVRAMTSAADLRDGVIKLSMGKKNHVLVKPV